MQLVESRNTQENLEDALDRAKTHHQAGRYVEAGRAYKDVLQLDSKHHGAIHQVGVLSYELGKYRDAKDFIQKAVWLAPKNAEYLNDLAVVQISLNQLDDAIANAQKAIELDPNNAQATQTLDEARRLKGGDLLDPESEPEDSTVSSELTADALKTNGNGHHAAVVVDAPVCESDESGDETADADEAVDPAHLALPRVESPFLEESLDGSEMDETSKRLIREFAANGFVIIDTNIPQDTLDAAAAIISLTGENRLKDAWRTTRPIEHIATDQHILETLELFYGRKAVPFQTLNYKNATEQQDHADTIHFGSFPRAFHCCVWVALEDFDAASGELHCFAGSHKLPALTTADLCRPGELSEAGDAEARFHAYIDFMQQLIQSQNLRKTPLKLKKGQAIIRAGNTIHGGSPAEDSSRTRMCQITQYGFDDCLYYSPEFSNVALGQVHPMLINDIRTQIPVEPHYNGLRVSNPGQWPPQLG